MNNTRMNVLFIPTCITTQHFETQLELMHKHLLAGDDVFVAKCRRYQHRCLLNTDYDWVSCIGNTLRLNQGLTFLDRKKIHEVRMPKVAELPEIPEVFNSIDDLVNYEVEGIGIGRGVGSQLINRNGKDHKLNTVVHQQQVSDELRHALYLYQSFKQLVAEVKPDLVYIFNGRFSTTRPLVEYCQKQAIPFYTHEATTVYTKYALFKNTIPHDLAYNAAILKDLWEHGADNKRDIATQWLENRRYNRDQGFYSYTEGQRFGNLPSGLDRSKKIIAIFNSTMEEYVTVPWWKNPLYRDESEGLQRIFESLKDDANIQLCLRVHPNLKNCNNSQIREIQELAKKYPNVIVIPPEDVVDSYSLMSICDTVLTFGSTIGVEACYWGKPSILAGRSYYEFLDCCEKPKNHDELVAMIQAPLRAKEKEEALKYGYWEAMRGIPFEYFKQTSMYGGGTFLGHETTLGKRTLFFVKLLRLLQVATYKKLWQRHFGA